jgi:opacity protein-like surface antigen
MKKLLLLCLLVLPVVLPAQNLKLNQGNGEATFSAKYDQAEMGLETRLGVFVQDYLQAGGYLAWADSDFATRTRFGIYSYRLLETRGYWLPYFGAGLGYGSVDLDRASSESGIELTLLTGIKYYLADNVALNTELAFGVSTGDTYISDDDLESTQIALTLGISYLW